MTSAVVFFFFFLHSSDSNINHKKPHRFFWEQFGRASNFFFLFTACVALVPEAAVIDPVLAVAPLIIVLVVAAVKEIVEDFRRVRCFCE